MADPQYTGSPLSGLFSFFADAPTAAPSSAQAMAARRRIAEAIVAGNVKKGFPKTLGEGLTAIGDALGERSQMRQLAEQDAAYQKAVGESAATLAPGEAKPPAPARTSELQPGTTVADLPDTETEQPPVTTVASRSTAPPEIQPGVVAQAPADGADPWQARSQAISGIESGGARDPYSLMGARTRTGDRAIGKYQVMAANVPEWTQAALGAPMTAEQFRASPDAQEAVFRHRFGGYVDKYGEEGAAKAWFAGEKGMNNPNATDVHGRLNVAGYGQDYLRRLGGAGGPRDNAAAVLAARGGPPDAQDARLAEVAGMTGGPTGAYSYPAVASRGDVQSDAPPIGITGGPGPAIGNAVTDTIQSRMQPPPAQGVPQPNPTLAGSTTPATGGLPGSVKVAQAAANNPPIVTDAITPQPQAQQPPPQPQRLTPAPRQPIITDEPMTDDEKRGWAARTKAMQLGSPELLDQANKLIEYGAGQRKEAYNAKLKDWQDQMLIQRQNQLEETKFARGAEQRNLEMAKTKAELTAQENANRLRAQFGNMDPAEAYKRLDASRDIAKGARQSMLASQEALHALDNGAITGIGANQRLDMAKLVTSLGLKDMGNEVQNTEVFRGAMQPIVANILHQTSGMSQLSEGELRFAAAAAAGNITLNASSMRELLRIIDTRSKEIINDHRTLTDALYGSEKNPQFHATWGVDVPPPKPGSTDAQALEWATQNANDPRAAAIKKKLGVR